MNYATHRPDLEDWSNAPTHYERPSPPQQRHGDRPRDDLGAARAIIWCALIVALVMLSSCVIKTRIGLANAAEPLQVHIIAHGLSKHVRNTSSSGYAYNERNPGAGLRLDGEWMPKSTALQIGHYYNSYRRHTTYAALDWLPLTKAAGPVQVSAGAFIGAVNGYPQADGGWSPAAGVVARMQLSRFSAALRASPGKGSRGVAALEVGVQIK